MSNTAAPTGSCQPRYPEIGVLALVPDFWGPSWQARHYILTRLAGYFRVLWVEPALELRPLLRGQRRKKRQDDVLPGMQVYRPEWWLPAVGKPRALANLTLKARLQRARQRLVAQGCRKIVLYPWRPEYAGALTLVPHDLSCYHIDDEYSFSPVDQPLSPAEEHLIRSAGQVFIHSPAMMEKKGHLNPNTQFAPNGVDFAAFSRPLPEPEDMRNIPHPRIGYCGGLKKVLDWPLLLQLASRHPQWSFVFAGSVRPHAQVPGYISQLAALPNVFFLGRKDTAALGSYIQHFDLCLMPYCCDGYTRYIYPLKLHEYLASGRPVVSSPIRTVQDFPEVVLPASSLIEWSQMIERGLSPQENSPERRAQRRRVAQAHDWNTLVESIAGTMARRLKMQHPSAGGCEAADPRSVPALTL
jgi:glycosyltransferase involved in cell wall biosynthesis